MIKAKPVTSLAILGVLSVFSFLLMSEKLLITVIVGFMIINLFKGCYRPILSAELILQYPFVSSMSTNQAITSIITTSIVGVLQFSMAFMFQDIENGNFAFAFFTLGTILIGYIYTLFPTKWEIKHSQNPITGKTGILEKIGYNLSFKQVYPVDTSFEHLQYIARTSQNSHIPSAMFEPFQNSKGQIGLITKFLGELHLSDIVDSSEQYDLCTKIVEKVPEEKNYFPPAKIVPEYYLQPKTT